MIDRLSFFGFPRGSIFGLKAKGIKSLFGSFDIIDIQCQICNCTLHRVATQLSTHRDTLPYYIDFRNESSPRQLNDFVRNVSSHSMILKNVIVINSYFTFCLKVANISIDIFQY